MFSDPQNRPPTRLCRYGCALYPGDPCYEIGGEIVCPDCLGGYAEMFFADCLRQTPSREEEWA